MGPSTESKVGKRVTTVFIPTLTKFQKDQDVALKVPFEFHRFSYTTSGALITDPRNRDEKLARGKIGIRIELRKVEHQMCQRSRKVQIHR